MSQVPCLGKPENLMRFGTGEAQKKVVEDGRTFPAGHQKTGTRGETGEKQKNTGGKQEAGNTDGKLKARSA